MDAIKYLVSGVDPIGRDADVPDGARVLADVFSRPEVFVDRVHVNVPTLTERRERRARIAGVLAVAAAAVTTGVLLTMNLGPLATAPSPAATSTAEATPFSTASTRPTSAPSPTATPAPEPPASTAATSVPLADEWLTYTSANGKVSFDHPGDWTVLRRPENPEYPAVDLDINDKEGKRIASLHYGASGGIGGACASPVPYEVLDSVELPLPYNASASDVIPPRFAYRVLLEADRVTASFGITSSSAGKDGKACMFYNVVSGPPESTLYSFADNFQVSAGGAQSTNSKIFSSLNEARAYMLTPEYIKAKRMLTSLRIVLSRQ
ncbi:hypothetical protein QFZ35_003424 [Arthrobacter ulcerisalmonis]|uniref:hypothetical protein n=1 Tax=Arthrobacter sp. B1I2 TaxID=3042263 RepID=UPI0027856F5D|nr:MULTISPECIES: hypothetical protein [Arthrobacter]MDQ0664926.1 hypothetical protein [Arthrobacter ulcerisalmonis]MDQ0732619.1 hypothetical protein [Arthrobacter sp. B1I2]